MRPSLRALALTRFSVDEDEVVVVDVLVVVVDDVVDVVVDVSGVCAVYAP